MESPYPLDQELGLKYYMSDSPGIKGKLRQEVKDFRVYEAFEPLEEGEGEYTHFTLEKENWDTIRAIDALARTLGVSRKRFGYAGTKDKRAITRQRVSVWGVEEERLGALNIEGLKVSDFRKSGQRVNLGYLKGNHFEITLRKVEGGEAYVEEASRETVEQLEERGVPCYFGYQRFGTVRPITHLVGKKVLQGDLEGATLLYLARAYPREREDAWRARKNLSESLDFSQALKEFPKRLNYERRMLDSLAKNPRDFAGALRRLPKKLRRMLVHAYQSYIFNQVLSRAMGEGKEVKESLIMLLGHSSGFSQGRIGELEKEVLEEEGMALEDFKVKSMPEMSVAGSQRKAALSTSFGFEVEDDDLNLPMLKVKFKFFLPPGNYATTVLREFMKADPLNY